MSWRRQNDWFLCLNRQHQSRFELHNAAFDATNNRIRKNDDRFVVEVGRRQRRDRQSPVVDDDVILKQVLFTGRRVTAYEIGEAR